MTKTILIILAATAAYFAFGSTGTSFEISDYKEHIIALVVAIIITPKILLWME